MTRRRRSVLFAHEDTRWLSSPTPTGHRASREREFDLYHSTTFSRRPLLLGRTRLVSNLTKLPLSWWRRDLGYRHEYVSMSEITLGSMLKVRGMLECKLSSLRGVGS